VTFLVLYITMLPREGAKSGMLAIWNHYIEQKCSSNYLSPCFMFTGSK